MDMKWRSHTNENCEECLIAINSLNEPTPGLFSHLAHMTSDELQPLINSLYRQIPFDPSFFGPGDLTPVERFMRTPPCVLSSLKEDITRLWQMQEQRRQEEMCQQKREEMDQEQQAPVSRSNTGDLKRKHQFTQDSGPLKKKKADP